MPDCKRPKLKRENETLNINFHPAFDRLQKYCLSAENDRFEKKDNFATVMDIFWENLYMAGQKQWAARGATSFL